MKNNFQEFIKNHIYIKNCPVCGSHNIVFRSHSSYCKNCVANSNSLILADTIFSIVSTEKFINREVFGDSDYVFFFIGDIIVTINGKVYLADGGNKEDKYNIVGEVMDLKNEFGDKFKITTQFIEDLMI